ncbi:MAG: glycosyltransferase N-terminal domain-containing protein [Alistipes sp.]|nr:glycosyltransferase N-terminal domain-containing protein [Alistipes sp.]
MHLLYNLGIFLMDFFALFAARFNPKVRLWVNGRKGIFDRMSAVIHPTDRIAWFHAASLGEFEQGRPVIEAFRQRSPEYKILVTFFSPSGYEIRKNYQGADYIFYLPSDTPRNVRRFMALVRPEIAVFIKYEFWINYLSAMRRAGTRLFLISALFRPEQVFFRPYGKLFRQALQSFEHLFVQNEESVALLQKIGITAVSVAGDTRFDRVYAIASQARDLPPIARFTAQAPVFIAGSTWAPDEELLWELVEKFPDVKFIIAPHEIDATRIDHAIARLSRPALRYTQLTPQSDLEGAGVLFIDTIGILSSVYRYARWGYIGGGFGAGIHNILEAATFGLPLSFGPRYTKFREACELIAQGGATSIHDAESLLRWFTILYQQPETSARSGEICRQYVAQHRGATEQIVKEICRK